MARIIDPPFSLLVFAALTTEIALFEARLRQGESAALPHRNGWPDGVYEWMKLLTDSWV
jgi:hypothetical protein